ncbi:unnamed protein product [Lactuca virosa]|uniref:Uncharacterized protein n=1 Tax=Lactuca virosa TaxID=75947 RepID=A0AAU9PKL8_9ASTR|nr:unnamed protein product [Lactuca virosa]
MQLQLQDSFIKILRQLAPTWVLSSNNMSLENWVNQLILGIKNFFKSKTSNGDENTLTYRLSLFLPVASSSRPRSRSVVDSGSAYLLIIELLFRGNYIVLIQTTFFLIQEATDS